MNLLEAIKNLSESIAIANETLQACVRELQAREQREMKLAEPVSEFLKKDNLQWVKFEDAYPTDERGCYVLGDPILGKVFCLQEVLTLGHQYKAWLKIPDFRDGK